MGRNAIVLDDRSLMVLNHKLEMLSQKELRRVQKKALQQSGNALLRTTRVKFNASIIQKGVMASRYPNVKPLAKVGNANVNKDATEVKINIMNPFLAKWIEKGTGPRYTKGHASSYPTKTRRRYNTPGLYRGAMSARRPFRMAIQESEGEMLNVIQQGMAKAIYRVAKK